MSLWSRRKVYVDNLPQTHDLRFAALFACGLIALLGGLYAVGYYVAGDRVPGGTTVAGVDLGNLTTAEAEAELADKVKPRLDRPIRLKGSDRELTLEPRQSGLTFDIDATVDRALDGESWDPRHMLRVLLGGDDLSPVIAVNQTALDQQLRRLASRLFDKPVESSVSFASGRPRVTAGNAGVELDIPLTRERVIAAFTRGSAVARLPLRAVAPQISPTEAADFVADVAAPAVSAPVDIAVGRDDVRLRPGQFSRSLQAEVSKDGGLRLAIDAESLFLRSRAQINALPSRPVDAKIRLVSGRPVVVPSRTGLAVTEQALADSVLRALRRSDSRRAVAETQVVEARFTTREVRDLQIRQRLSSSVVSYEAVERDAVLKQANNLDGTLLGAG
ncbi:MAG: peptidoglycan binding domain-containing protein, partial [Actinomycetota bacterium]|nr:peptidoglycan binding domain-containing protein [Actinomycetota bacterium]